MKTRGTYFDVRASTLFFIELSPVCDASWGSADAAADSPVFEKLAFLHCGLIMAWAQESQLTLNPQDTEHESVAEDQWAATDRLLCFRHWQPYRRLGGTVTMAECSTPDPPGVM